MNERYLETIEFRNQILNDLESCIGLRIEIAQDLIDRKFQEYFNKNKNPLFLENDLVMVGMKAYIENHRYYQTIIVRPETKLFPRERYSIPDIKSVEALGMIDEYDLYIGHQVNLPPTLIARYGNEPEEYLTWNPAFSKSGESVHPIFQFAQSRAVIFSDVWTEWQKHI